jgi:hypothetical protein
MLQEQVTLSLCALTLAEWMETGDEQHVSFSLSLLLALNLTGARQHYALCDVSIGVPCDI